MKKKLIRLSEQDLHNIIKESVNNILMNEAFSDYYNVSHFSDVDDIDEDDYTYMSDEDIENQYDDFEVTYLDVERWDNAGFKGTIELSFPNADDVTFDSTTVDNFYIYDDEMTRFGFDNWYPQEISEKLKEIIKNYIIKNNI